MTLVKTHKIALAPNLEQLKMFGRHAGYARLAYNEGLADFKAGLDIGEWRSAYDLNKRFNAVKREKFEWCTELNQTVADRAITVNLGRAIKSFGDYRKRAKSGNPGRFFGFPKFKKRGLHDAFFAQRKNKQTKFHITDTHIRIPKIGDVRMCESLRFDGEIKQVYVVRTGNRWFACLTVDTKVKPRRERRGAKIGVDVGISKSATASNGLRMENPKALNRYRRKLGRIDKAISRSRRLHPEDSKRRDRLMNRRRAVHARVVNIREDAQHKFSTQLVKLSGQLAVENLNVSGMLKNRRLARAISDAAMYSLTSKLEYKCHWNGVKFAKVDQWYPSTKRCSNCGSIKGSMLLSDREYKCTECNFREDRDFNAAVNIAAFDAEDRPESLNGHGAGVRGSNRVSTRRESSGNEVSIPPTQQVFSL